MKSKTGSPLNSENGDAQMDSHLSTPVPANARASSEQPPGLSSDDRRSWRFRVFSVLLLAALIRLVFVMDSGITGDEANMVAIAHCSTWEIISGIALDDSNPPLFMVLLRGLLVTFGDHVWVWKLTCTALNLTSVWVMMGLFRRWIGPEEAVIGGVLAAIHPWQVYMATEVRGYALAALLAIVAIDAAQRFESARRMRWALVWSAACAAGFWTHYSVAVVALVTGTLTLIQLRRQPRALALWCVAGLGAVAVMALWLPQLAEQNVRHSGGVAHLWHLGGLPIIHAAGTTFLRPAVSTVMLAAGGSAVLLVFGLPACVGAAHLWRTRRSVAVLVLILLAASVIVPLIRSAVIGSLAFSSRYTFVVHLATSLLVACGLMAARRWRRHAGLAGIILLCMLSLAQLKFAYVGRASWQTLVTKVLAQVSDDEALLVPNIAQAMRLRYFSNGRFPNLFVGSSNSQYPAYIHPDATWTDVYNGLREPDGFFTEAAATRLGKFATVWQLPKKSAGDRLSAFDMGYSITNTVTLLPGGQFGAEAPAYLIRWMR